MQKQKDGVHALLLTNDGKVILQEKGATYTYNPVNAGKISMFGGGIEEGEEVLDALRRELLEELDLAIDNYIIENLNTYSKTIELDGADTSVYVYSLKSINPAILEINKETEGDEERSTGFTIDTAENFLKNPKVTRITKLALEDFLKEATEI